MVPAWRWHGSGEVLLLWWFGGLQRVAVDREVVPMRLSRRVNIGSVQSRAAEVRVHERKSQSQRPDQAMPARRGREVKEWKEQSSGSERAAKCGESVVLCCQRWWEWRGSVAAQWLARNERCVVRRRGSEVVTLGAEIDTESETRARCFDEEGNPPRTTRACFIPDTRNARLTLQTQLLTTVAGAFVDGEYCPVHAEF